MSALGQKQTYAVRKGHVRFTPESGHVRRNYECPLWAKSGHSSHVPESLKLVIMRRYFVIGIRGSIAFSAEDRIRRYRVLRRIFRRTRDSARKINCRRFHDFNAR